MEYTRGDETDALCSASFSPTGMGRTHARSGLLESRSAGCQSSSSKREKIITIPYVLLRQPNVFLYVQSLCHDIRIETIPIHACSVCVTHTCYRVVGLSFPQYHSTHRYNVHVVMLLLYTCYAYTYVSVCWPFSVCCARDMVPYADNIMITTV